jgi:hypothetical protein
MNLVVRAWIIFSLALAIANVGCAKDEENPGGGGASAGTPGQNPPGPSPTAGAVALTGNGSTEITVSVGDTINYAWSSARLNSIASYYSANMPDQCPGGYSPWAHANNTQIPWVVTTANETAGVSATVQECQRGVDYTIRIVGQTQAGNIIQALLVVRVRP